LLLVNQNQEDGKKNGNVANPIFFHLGEFRRQELIWDSKQGKRTLFSKNFHHKVAKGRDKLTLFKGLQLLKEVPFAEFRTPT